MSKISKALKTLEDMIEREKHSIYPDSLEYTQLRDDRIEALKLGMDSIKAMDSLSCIHYDLDLNSEYSRGFDDGIDFIFDKIDWWWDFR